MESLTPAEQLRRVRDLCADWDRRLSDPGHNPYARELAKALGVALGVVGLQQPSADALPEPKDVPCQHQRADGVCTICGDAPLFPDGYAMPPLPTLPEVRAVFWRHYDRVTVVQRVPRGHRARQAAWQELTTAEQYVLGSPDDARPRPRGTT